MNKFRIDLQERHGRQYLNGVRVRDTDTFTYELKGKGWQHGFKSIQKVMDHMEKQDTKLVDKFICVDLNARVHRGERPDLEKAKQGLMKYGDP